MLGLSPVVASGGHSSSWCVGLSLSRPLLLWSTGSRCAGSAVVAHGPSCSAACGIFPDQGPNPCPLVSTLQQQPLGVHPHPLQAPALVTSAAFRDQGAGIPHSSLGPGSRSAQSETPTRVPATSLFPRGRHTYTTMHIYLLHFSYYNLEIHH